MLFMGEEWGASTPFLYFTDHEDPELARAVSIGRQKDFEKIGWDPSQVPDPQDPRTMERSKLVWDEVERSPHREMLEWHRELIRLRRRYADLTDGRLERAHVEYDEEARWLLLRRGVITMVVNFAEEAREVLVRGLGPRDLLAASDEAIRVEGNRVALAPESVAVLGPKVT